MDGIVMKQPIATTEDYVSALDFLASLDFIKITQKVDIAELLTPWEIKNRYEVSDAHDRVFMRVTEESETCQRVCCMPSQRSLVLHVTDMNGQDATSVRKNPRTYCCYPKVHLMDGDGKQIFELTGPCCPCQGPGCYEDLEYPLKNPGGSDAGAKVTKIWDGAGRACCTHATTFGCHFPVKRKLSILGSVFVLDFLLFESDDE